MVNEMRIPALHLVPQPHSISPLVELESFVANVQHPLDLYHHLILTFTLMLALALAPPLPSSLSSLFLSPTLFSPFALPLTFCLASAQSSEAPDDSSG